MTILRRLAMFSMMTAAGCGILGGDDHEVAISGSVVVPAARMKAAAAPGGRTITHVMAVNPETASPQRTLEVSSDQRKGPGANRAAPLESITALSEPPETTSPGRAP